MLVLNLTFLGCFAQYFYQLTPLFILLCVGYLMLYLVQSKINIERMGTWGILTIVILFIYLKQYAFIKFIPFFSFPVIVIGLSFILFRIIHLLVDVSLENLSRCRWSSKELKPKYTQMLRGL